MSLQQHKTISQSFVRSFHFAWLSVSLHHSTHGCTIWFLTAFAHTTDREHQSWVHLSWWLPSTQSHAGNWVECKCYTTSAWLKWRFLTSRSGCDVTKTRAKQIWQKATSLGSCRYLLSCHGDAAQSKNAVQWVNIEHHRSNCTTVMLRSIHRPTTKKSASIISQLLLPRS